MPSYEGAAVTLPVEDLATPFFLVHQFLEQRSSADIASSAKYTLRESPGMIHNEQKKGIDIR